jgi:hypothetical protein
MIKQTLFICSFVACSSTILFASTNPTEMRHNLEKQTTELQSTLETFDKKIHERMQRDFENCERLEVGKQRTAGSCAFPKIIHAAFFAAHANMHHTQTHFEIVKEASRAHLGTTIDSQIHHKTQAGLGESVTPVRNLARILAFSKTLHEEKDSAKRIQLDTIRKEDNNTSVFVSGNGEDLQLYSQQCIEYLQSVLAQSPLYNTLHTSITANADYTMITIRHRISQGQKRDIQNFNTQPGAIQYVINLLSDEFEKQQQDPTRAGRIQLDKDTSYYISSIQNGSEGLSGEIQITLPIKEGIQYLFNMHLVKPEALKIKSGSVFEPVWSWITEPTPTQTTTAPANTASESTQRPART